MGRRTATIKDRGVSAPPPGYRPGRKAGWLHPRPIHPAPSTPEDNMQLTAPVTLLFNQTPNDLDTVPGPTLPAFCQLIAVETVLNTSWDNLADNPRLQIQGAYLNDTPLLSGFTYLTDPPVPLATPIITAPKYSSIEDNPTVASLPTTTTLIYRDNGPGGTASAGSITVRLGFLPFTP